MGTTPKNKAIDAEYLLNQLKNLDKDILETKYVQEKDVKDTYTATDENPISGKGVAVAVNTLQQDINKKSNIGHKHTKSEITDFPTSMTPTAHNQASNTINAMTDYSKATSVSAITPTDTLNVAIGKLEKALDSKGTSSFSGSYNDLTDKPTIPSVGNGTITVNQNGTKVGEFSTNQSTNTAINLTNTTYDVATSSKLGLVKSGTDITVDNSGNVSVNDDSHNHIISNVDGLQIALDGKAASSHTHDDRYYTESEINTKLNSKLNTSLKGSASGLAELDSNGKVPSTQLPSFVDDVIEGYLYNGKFYKESAHTTVITGESGKIYIDLATEKTYRWSGSTFAIISDTLALGETSTTAYRGDRGKTAYDHSQSAHAPTNAQANVIETVKVNGTALTPSSKAVNISVPTNNNQLTNGAGYITSSGTAKTISDTLPISKGGTGQTTAVNAANTLINSLSTGESTPTDADYYISQYVGGGTTTTTYHRRPMSALWNYIKSKLATVATSGSYNDLSNKPTIPTVGNGTITIKQAGTNKGTFTMNQSGNTTIELTDTDTNTWRPLGTTADTACAGNDSRLSNARPASDVYSWAKASSKPSYSYSEISGTPSSLPANGGTSTATYYVNINNNESKSDGRLQFFQKSGDSTINPDTGWWSLIRAQHPGYNNGYWQELALPFNSGGRPQVRQNVNGTKSSWKELAYTSDIPSSLPASDVYAWAKASSKPSYSWSEITSKPSTFTPASHTHNYAGSSSAGGSATSAVSVVDYGDSSKTIEIGYSGAGATVSNLTHIAGYLTGGTQIKDVNKVTLKSWLDLGSAAYTNSDAYAASSHTHNSIYLKYTTVNVSQSSTVEIWRSNEPNSRKRLVLFTAKTYNNYHHNIVWFYNGKLYAPDFSSSVGNNTTLNNFTCTNTTVNYNNTETSTYPSAVAIVRCYDFMG